MLASCRAMAPGVSFFVQKKDLVYSGFFGAGASQWILFVPKYIARVCDENARVIHDIHALTARNA